MKENVLKAKEEAVASIQDKISGSQGVVFYDYRGLTVEEVTNLRKQMREAGAEYKVLKNTMVKRAVDNLGISGIDHVLEGPTAVIFGVKDPVAPAKILVDFIGNIKKTEIKGGILSGRDAIDEKAIENLAKLPSKEELVAKMLGSLNAPISGLVMALSGVMRNFVYALNAVKEKKEQEA
ncbi:MAG: 50S ribosomal protein L10 [Clostridia bacterium]|nr:50S ribosomal protein L10 [Clostridia bacterium]